MYLCHVIMWWPPRAPAPLVAEKGTQVRLLGRTRCCIFPIYNIACRISQLGHCQPNALVGRPFKASDGNEPEDLPRYR